MFSTLLTFALGTTGALAHGGVLSYSNAGNWFWGWQPYNSPTGQTSIQRPWSSYNPIQGATTSTLACNDDGTAGALQLTATMAAGSKVTAYWNVPWPHNTGPMLTYLSACNGACTSVNTETAKWFKIDEAGLINGTIYSGTWASGVMIAQNSTWTTTIPSSVPSGNYFIRFETIALHSMPAQYYPECAQITITGGGSLQPTAAELVTFPGGYSDNDPGLNIDIYDQQAEVTTNYTIPGPPLYAGATPSIPSAPGSSSGSGSSGGSGGGTTVTPTTVKPTTSTPTSTPSSGSVAEYGQCGGSGYTGPTSCQSPYVCSVINPYYSQCVAA